MKMDSMIKPPTNPYNLTSISNSDSRIKAVKSSSKREIPKSLTILIQIKTSSPGEIFSKESSIKEGFMNNSRL